MTPPLVDPHAVAAALVAEQGWRFPATSVGRCGRATYMLQRALPGAGRVRVWTDYGHGPDGFGQRRAEHNAALLRGRVWDLTASQFGIEHADTWTWGLDDWVEVATGWLRPGDDDLVVAEVWTADDRLRRSWRVPVEDFQ